MALPALSAGRPVNTLFLLDAHAQLDARTRDFLQRLTQTSGGRCHVVLVGLNGVLEKVKTSSELRVKGQTVTSPESLNNN